MIGTGKLSLLKQACLPVALLCLAGCATGAGTAAAGSGSGSTTTTTTFTAADLKGTYVYSVKGSNTDDGDYAVLGAFTADGNGKITNGEADYNFGSGIDSAVMMTGTYAVNSSGTAVIVLTDGVGVNDNMTVTLAKSGTSTITSYLLNGTGTLQPASPSGYTPLGNFTYTLTGEGYGAVTGSGTFSTASNGTISGGTNIYTDNGRTINQMSNAGFMGLVNAQGRAYASIAGHTFALYPTSSTAFLLIGIDENALLTGSGTKQ